MTEEIDIQENVDNWRPKVLVIGAVLGAAVGLGAAYLLIHRVEKEGEELNITPVDGVKLGVLVFGLLRSVSQLGGGA